MTEQQRKAFNPDTVMSSSGAYSQAVLEPKGRTLHVAGQTGVTADKKLPGDGGIEAQTEQMMINLRLILEAAGGTLGDVVATTAYLTDMNDKTVFNEVRAKHFAGSAPPTSTLVEVSGLFVKPLLVEISAIAVIPEPDEGSLNE